MSLAPGTRFGPYEIIGAIGAGGMGEVYRARDTRLDRTVAIKVLTADVTRRAHLRARFEREARAISVLNHPNICTLFDVGHQDDIDFLVMECIEGETLAALLGRERLDEQRVVDLGMQIADALAEAHDRSIIHRDIKPQNVIVTPRGQVKVLDFGLAKIFEGQKQVDRETRTASPLSQDGALVGTGPYMSPEQVRGEPLDPRSDAFSFGALLYEMVCGRPPFGAVTLPETLSAILTAEPPPLARFAPDISGELQRIVRKCLEKDRTRRYQSLRDVALDLETLRRDLAMHRTATDSGASARSSAAPDAGQARRSVWAAVLGAATLALIAVAVAVSLGRLSGRHPADPVARSLAVLPFKPLAGDLKENYFGLGLADAVITRLSQTGQLMVRPTSAMRRYATGDTDTLNAAREQQVDTVLDGAWQREGDRLRVSVNLLRVSDGASLWAESFDVRASEVFALQDRVSEQLVNRLRLELDPNRRARLRQSGTTNPEAYDAFAKGVFYFGERGYNQKARDNSDRATILFQRAVALDPDYAQAHALLGYADAWTAVFIEDNPSLIERAKESTRIAERLAPNLDQVHLNWAFILQSKYEGWRIADALREQRRAEQLGTGLADVELASLYVHLGFLDDWRRILERNIARDPTNRQLRTVHVNEYFLLNLPEDGLAAQKRLLNEGPDQRYFLLTRRVQEAAPLVEGRIADAPNDTSAVMDLALLRALQGRHDEAQKTALRSLSVAAKNRFYHHVTYNAARVYALGGNAEQTAKWLDETIRWGFPCYPVFASDRFLDSIKTATSFQKVMAQLKTDWERYRTELQ